MLWLLRKDIRFQRWNCERNTEEGNESSYDKVKAAIAEYDKTFALSVGQHTVGVTILEWIALPQGNSIYL